MARDGEIPAIFNPKKVRAPSVVVTGDSPNGPFGGFTPAAIQQVAQNMQQQQQLQQSHHTQPPQITHSDSVTSSQHDGNESLGGTIQMRCDTPTPLTNQPHQTQASRSRLKRCKDSCCSPLAQKVSH